MQVKEDEQLVELTESIQHMFDKLDDFVKYREEKAKLMYHFKEEVSTLKERLETVDKESHGEDYTLNQIIWQKKNL